MDSTKVTTEGFDVIGLQIRTSNAKEFSGEGQIASLWERFFSEGVSAKVLGKLEENMYGVYHDYESDMSGEYSVTVGFKVKPGTSVASGLSLVKIPKQTYVKFTTDTGEMPGVVVEGWKHIWGQKDLSRKYTADYELYDERCANPKNAQLDIFIAVK